MNDMSKNNKTISFWFVISILALLLPAGTSAEPMGQSWSKPKVCKIASGPKSGDVIPTQTVFLISGGYDSVNQDQETPAAMDSMGRGIFTYIVLDGTAGNFSVENGNYSDMTHSIIDVLGIDHDGDNIVSRVYAGDMGGNMFYFKDDDVNGAVDGTWINRKLFSAPYGNKIFYTPDVVEEAFGEMIFFGTGDRSHPSESTIENRFYAIKNTFNDDDDELTELTRKINCGVTNADGNEIVDLNVLWNVTDNLLQMGTEQEKAAEKRALTSDCNLGWYIRLEEPGEKVVSTPITFGGVVYFTTYVPGEDPGATPSPCDTPDTRGRGYLYAVEYLTGVAAFNFSDEEERNHDNEVVERGKKDRKVKLKSKSIPPPPVIIVPEDGPPKIIVGFETKETKPRRGLDMFYWRKM